MARLYWLIVSTKVVEGTPNWSPSALSEGACLICGEACRSAWTFSTSLFDVPGSNNRGRSP